MPNVPKLLGRAEVAAVLGVHRSNVDQLAGLPDPYMSVAATRLWLESDILRFKSDRARRRRAQDAIRRQKVAA